MNEEKFYLTKERYDEIVEELKNLKTDGRRKVTERLRAAKEMGDLSENSEYQEARDDQDAIEQRINQLEEIVRNSEIIKKSRDKDTVGIGSKVKVRKGGAVDVYTIVGSSEADPEKGFVSNESPFGMSLLGKRAGDEARIKTPKGEVVFQVVRVE